MPQPERPGLSALGGHPHDGQKALSVLNMISDRLLGATAQKERELISERTRAALAAAKARGAVLGGDRGCRPTGIAATGYYLQSVPHQDEGDIAGAVTLRAAEAGRHADVATAAVQLANTARCILELEFDTTRADGLLKEAGALLHRSRTEAVEYFWGGALLKRWGGSLSEAVLLMKGALRLARENEDRWRECKCLTWLAAIHLESGAPKDVLSYCEELRRGLHGHWPAFTPPCWPGIRPPLT